MMALPSLWGRSAKSRAKERFANVHYRKAFLLLKRNSNLFWTRVKVCSIFSQVLKLFPRRDFEQAVKEHKAERHARGFPSWGQFMAMLFCQLGRAHSWREICGGLACCEGQLKHLGVPVAPKSISFTRAGRCVSPATNGGTFTTISTPSARRLRRCAASSAGEPAIW